MARMWLWARNCECGIVTDIAFRLESLSPREAKVARREGKAPRRAGPRRRMPSFGLKPRVRQLSSWKWLATVALESSAGSPKSAPDPFRVEITCEGAQLDGLRVKSRRSM